MEEISKNKVFMNYYYPDIDRFTIAKDKHIKSVKKHNDLSENKNRSTYVYKNNELSKFLNSSSSLPYGRLHRFFRPDSPAFWGQTYVKKEVLINLTFGEFTRDKRTLDKFNRIVKNLEKILETNDKYNKDIYVLASVIHVNNIYKFFLTLEENGSFTADLTAKRSLYFKPRKKLFLTDDASFPFTQIEKIENAFPGLSIKKTKLFIKDFDKFIC
jgi:hypothetical protein